MEEKKLNELNDEALDKVAGGVGFIPTKLFWCPTCKENKRFSYVMKTSFTCVYVCPGCKGTDYEAPH